MCEQSQRRNNPLDTLPQITAASRTSSLPGLCAIEIRMMDSKPDQPVIGIPHTATSATEQANQHTNRLIKWAWKQTKGLTSLHPTPK